MPERGCREPVVGPSTGAAGTATTREPIPDAGAGLRRPVVAGVAGKVAEAATLVLLATVVPRLLGPTDYGRLSVALTVVAVGSVALTLGGATLLARYVPAAPPPQRRGLARALTLRLARNRIAPFALLGAAAAVAVAADRLPPAATAWVLLALALNVAATLALQADLGLGRAAAWSARYPVQNAVLVAAVVALYVVAGLPGALVAVPVAGAAGLALALAATAPLWRAPDRGPVDLPPDTARFGLAAAGTGALTQLVQRGGVVATALLATDEATGHAAVAIGVALAATYAVTQIFVVTLPAFAARQARGGDGPGGAEPALRRLGGLLLAAVLPVTAVAMVAVDVVVLRVLGAAYTDAVAAFPLALATVVLAPLTALLVQAAALRLRPEATLGAAAVGAGVFVAVAVLAVPGWGATGATGAALAGTAATAVAGLVAVPGAAGWRLATASLAGAGVVAGFGVLA